MIKEIAIQISVKHIRANDLVFQRFTILGSKRDWRYLLDPRFYTKRVFDGEILNRSLSWEDGYIFCDRIETDNEVELRYGDNEEETYLDDYFFTIHDFVPSTFGCEYCRFNKEEINEEQVQCDFFNKPTRRRKGSCKYFDQRRLFKT